MIATILAMGLLTMTHDAADPNQGTLKVVTYNIHHGEGTDGRLDLPRIAELIRREDPDLVALQELDVKTTRVGGADQLAELAQATGLHGAFGKAIAYAGGDYGVGILSRWPLTIIENRALPSSPEREARTALVVRVATPFGSVRVISTHLDHKSVEDRTRQAVVVASLAGPEPTLVAGDLNDLASSPALAPVAEAFLDAGKALDLPTYPSDKPAQRIDYILGHPKDSWKVIEFRVLVEAVASDHRPVVAVLAYGR